MINFKPLGMSFLNIDTGDLYDPSGELTNKTSTQAVAPQELPDFGVPHMELAAQVNQMKKKGRTIEQVHKAIEGHPQITDYTKAKELATNFFGQNLVPNYKPAGIDPKV